MATPSGHVSCKFGDTVNNGHGLDSYRALMIDVSDTGTKAAAMPENTLIHDPDAGIERLLEIMRRLRDPDSGCPWDIEQDFASIAPYTIEEAYEVADAIERKSWPDLEAELGDLLLQSVYHTQMGEEAGLFSFQSVVRAISDKMVARHPHVFGDESRDKTAQQQTVRLGGDQKPLNAKVRHSKALLMGLRPNLPALLRALKLQNRAAPGWV